MLLNSNPTVAKSCRAARVGCRIRPHISELPALSRERVRCPGQEGSLAGDKTWALGNWSTKEEEIFFSIWKRGSEKRHTVKNNLEPLPLSKDHQVTKTISLNPA